MSTDMKMKITSPWIAHVKAFAKENGLKYNEALRDPNLKVGYVKVERVKKESKSSPKMEQPMMEMNRNYDKLEPVVVVKKGRKKKEMVMVEQPMVIQTESGDLQQVPEMKKVRAKRAEKKKNPAMM